MPLRKTVPAAITGLLSGFFAHGAVATTSFNTSYGPVPVSSTGVVAAARFAATTKSVAQVMSDTNRDAETSIAINPVDEDPNRRFPTNSPAPT